MTPSPHARPVDLVVVMPVFNEEGCIQRVVGEWTALLDELDLAYELQAINDGSRDRTPGLLDELASHPRVRVSHKHNEGHGPTILRGYRDAVRRSQWIFQVDADDEIDPAAFQRVWERREGNDAVLGRRAGREQTGGRRLLSLGARAAVRLAYGSGVADVNTPFRLLRAAALEPILETIPPEASAPNVLVTGALLAVGARVAEVPVPHQGRSSGQTSLVGLRTARAAARALAETALHARRVGKRRDG